METFRVTHTEYGLRFVLEVDGQERVRSVAYQDGGAWSVMRADFTADPVPSGASGWPNLGDFRDVRFQELGAVLLYCTDPPRCA